MQEQHSELQQLFDEAQRYERAGDSYTAIKLYKRLIKLAPDWTDAYRQLAGIYKQRREWKPTFHYLKKTIALDSSRRDCWWEMGIAATALKKWRLARSVWTKFGRSEMAKQPMGLRLHYDGMFEILWMLPLDPARGQILSLPHPASGFRFRDVLLYDREPVGHHIVNRRRIPVHEELGLFKRSPYRTFSCVLHTADPKHIQQLEKLCHEADLGFEVWSNASRNLIAENRLAFPEYYSRDVVPTDPGSATLVAMAALHEIEIQRTLDAWQIVSLQHYSDLNGY